MGRILNMMRIDSMGEAIWLRRQEEWEDMETLRQILGYNESPMGNFLLLLQR
jgi:hypothetical protein